MNSFLRRAAHEYTPSVDDEDYEACNDARKKGAGYRSAAAEARRNVLSYNSKSADTRKLIDSNLQRIQSLCEGRRIVPQDEELRKELREAEMLHADHAGPASLALIRKETSRDPKRNAAFSAAMKRDKDKKKRVAVENDGYYEISKFADMLSAAMGGGPEDEEIVGYHTHERTETSCYQLPHRQAAHTEAFYEDSMFTTNAVLARSDTVLMALMSLPQYDACERALDKYRDARKAGGNMKWQFGPYVTHFFETCGVALFCAYVRRDDPGVLFTLFEMDGVQRHFLLTVFSINGVTSAEDTMSAAKTWHDDAMRRYEADMQNPERAPYTFKPCERFEPAEENEYWTLYNLTACESLREQSVTFLYAYYTACQCVELE